MWSLHYHLLIFALLLFSNYHVHSRILNGNEKEQASEYAVEVTSQFENYQSWGGGTLIANNVVVTTAQLIRGSSKILVRFGSNNWDDAMYNVEVIQHRIFPNYNPETMAHNFGLLRLAQTMDTSEFKECIYYIPINSSTILFSRSWTHETNAFGAEHAARCARAQLRRICYRIWSHFHRTVYIPRSIAVNDPESDPE